MPSPLRHWSQPMVLNLFHATYGCILSLPRTPGHSRPLIPSLCGLHGSSSVLSRVILRNSMYWAGFQPDLVACTSASEAFTYGVRQVLSTPTLRFGSCRLLVRTFLSGPSIHHFSRETLTTPVPWTATPPYCIQHPRLSVSWHHASTHPLKLSDGHPIRRGETCTQVTLSLACLQSSPQSFTRHAEQAPVRICIKWMTDGLPS